MFTGYFHSKYLCGCIYVWTKRKLFETLPNKLYIGISFHEQTKKVLARKKDSILMLNNIKLPFFPETSIQLHQFHLLVLTSNLAKKEDPILMLNNIKASLGSHCVNPHLACLAQ